MSEQSSRFTALIVGGGPAEAQAAVELARAGVGVTLLTADDWLTTGAGGPLDIPCLLEAARHPHIALMTGATVEKCKPLPRDGASGRRPGLRVTVHQSPRYVDPERCTACGACAEVCPVLLPGADASNQQHWWDSPAGIMQGGDTYHKAIYRGAVPTTYVVDKAGTAPCRYVCPIDQRAQGYIALIRAGEFEAAYRTIKRENPFPSVCGRVCNHRCEDACTRCQVDDPVAVMALKRFVADWAAESGARVDVEIAPRSGRRVAVVGSGPAGLTAARELNRRGHAVVVFEALPVPGGMMRVGIPAFRLPRDRLQWEIEDILDEGVQLRTSARVDDVEDLFVQGYDAVVLAVGLHVSRQPAIPGVEKAHDERETDQMAGVMGAVEFLRTVNLGDRPDLTCRRVLVVGGGSTAMDTARVCRRLGAEVEVVYRRSRSEMPAHDYEAHDAQCEGVTIRFLTNPSRIVRQNGRVVAVECVEMALGEPDESGRRRPLPIEGSEFRLPADFILLAIGQASDLLPLSGLDAVTHQQGIVDHDPETLMTARPGLFVAGDVAGTNGFVVDAIASGSQAARSVDRYLRDIKHFAQPFLQPTVELSDEQVAQRLAEAAPKATPRARVRSIRPETLRGDFGETSPGLSEAAAMAEAARCLGCGLCSECLACVEVCPARAIDHERMAQVTELDADVSIWVEDGTGIASWRAKSEYPGVFVAHDGVDLAQVVDRALAYLGAQRPPPSVTIAAPGKYRLRSIPTGKASRVGVFLCRCGGEIEKVVDLAAVATRVEELYDTAYVETVDFACHPEGNRAIRSAVTAQELKGAVLAACSCCALDQICYSCTTQRTRCKERLAVWDEGSDCPVEFVNVREQCAYVHGDHPAAATLKAGDMVAASVVALGLPRTETQGAGGQCVASASRVAITACIDPVRCRGCDDCESICGLDAVHVRDIDGARIARVDATRCLGCGICVSVCSSGAILAGDMADAQAEGILTAFGGLGEKTVVFTCNWGAYSAIEAAGVARLAYDPSVRVIRLMCAGRAHTGLIMRAFAHGAARVLVLTCGYEKTEPLCRYHTGSLQAARSVEQAGQLLALLGIDPTRLALAEMRPGDGAGFVATVRAFTELAAGPIFQERI